MKKLFFITLMLAFGLTASSQTQFLAIADGDWNANSTWNQNTVPGAADFVKINSGHYVTIQSSTTAECANVEVGDVTANGVLTVDGTLTISETAGLSVAVIHTNSQLTVNGTLTYTGNVDIDAGLLIVNGTMEYLPPPPVPTVLNPTTGEIWMDRNLGASQVATSSTDALAYGDLYQWGRATEGHEDRNNSNTTTTLATTAAPNTGGAWDALFIVTGGINDWLTTPDDNLWQGDGGINDPCPAGFRLPTQTEWEVEHNSWATQDNDGAFGSPLKLTVGGWHNRGNGNLEQVGATGYYWSSTAEDPSSHRLHFSDAVVGVGTGLRPQGYSVRCIKD